MDTNNTQTNPLNESNQADTRSSKNMNLQDLYLNVARKEKIVITIFLMNGFQLKGIVKGFDTYVVILEVEGKTSMVYKHAISTISPSSPINVFS